MERGERKGRDGGGRSVRFSRIENGVEENYGVMGPALNGTFPESSRGNFARRRGCFTRRQYFGGSTVSLGIFEVTSKNDYRNVRTR